MFKVTSQPDATTQGVFLIIEGRLAGPWVAELEAYCRVVSENRQRCTLIDLTGVTFIDAEGRALLARLWQDGAELRASGCLTRCVVEEITGVRQMNGADELCRNHKEVDSKNGTQGEMK